MLETNTDRTVYIGYFLLKVEVKDCNVMIDSKNLTKVVKSGTSDIRSNENIRKIVPGKGNDYATGCLLGYPYFK